MTEPAVRATRLVVALVVALGLSGCDRQAAFDRLVPTEEAAFARARLAALADRDLEAVESSLSPALRNEAIRAEIRALAEAFPRRAPDSVTLVGVYTDSTGPAWRGRFTWEYAYPDTWVLAGLALHRDGESLFVDGLNVERHATPVAERVRPTLDTAGPAHVLVLIAAVAVPLFVLHTLVSCARSAELPFRWLWIAFVMLGAGAVSLDWSTGAIAFSPFRVLLFGVGVDYPLYAPLTLSVALPVGAIAFRLRGWLPSAGR